MTTIASPLFAPTAINSDTHAVAERPSGHRFITGTVARMALILAVVLGIFLTAVGGASATVLSGAGGKAFPVTKCHGVGSGGAEIAAHVVQDFAGEYVGARLWIHDNQGWRHTAWVTSNNPGWSSDGSVVFNAYFTGLRGTAYAYLEYGWYRNGGWVTGGEYPRYYSSLFGGTYTTCLV